MRILGAFFALTITFYTPHYSDAEELNMAALPKMILNLASMIAQNNDILMDNENGVPLAYELLSPEYHYLYDLLFPGFKDGGFYFVFYREADACLLKGEIGFSCGDVEPEEKRSKEYLYVSDVIDAHQDYILIIESNTAPQSTLISKLYNDHIEILYNRRDGETACNFIDANTNNSVLGITYNVKYLGNEKFELREEINNYYSYDARVIEMDLSQGDCSLKTLEKIEVRPLKNFDEIS